MSLLPAVEGWFQYTPRGGASSARAFFVFDTLSCTISQYETSDKASKAGGSHVP